MTKKNCWEFMDCPRTNPGAFVDGKNTCPASNEETGICINSGEKAGRACWAVAGTFSQEVARGEHSKKLRSCVQCEFYKKVREEEGDDFLTGSELADLLLTDKNKN